GVDDGRVVGGDRRGGPVRAVRLGDAPDRREQPIPGRAGVVLSSAVRGVVEAGGRIRRRPGGPGDRGVDPGLRGDAVREEDGPGRGDDGEGVRRLQRGGPRGGKEGRRAVRGDHGGVAGAGGRPGHARRRRTAPVRGDVQDVGGGRASRGGGCLGHEKGITPRPAGPYTRPVPTLTSWSRRCYAERSAW